MRALALAVLLASIALTGAAAAATPEPDGPCPPATALSPEEPRITAVHADTVAPGNAGEYFLLTLPEPTDLAGWRVTDGHTTARLPAGTREGPVAVTMDPATTSRFTDHPTAELEGHLRLAADGDELTLEAGDRTVDRVRYGQVRTAERWYRTGPGPTEGALWPRGATCLAPLTVTPGEATAFVLPDDPETPIAVLEGATDRIRLGAYTLTEERVVDALVAAADRGVDVAVLLEGGPVGGHPPGTEAAIDRLTAAGIPVRAIGTGASRYPFHHPKYAVVDDRVLVMTENWDPAGVGGASSRGWGVVFRDAAAAAYMTTVFDADASSWDVGDAADLESAAGEPPSSGSFPSTFQPETVAVDRAELVLAPDAADERLAALLRNATESVLIKQPRIPDARFALVEATLEAARNGAEVSILLDSTWYVEEENRATAAAIEERAARESLDVAVRLDDPAGYEKIHSKGIVIDDEVAVVGSLNWNDNSLTANREVMVVLHGAEAASYYRAVFEADWDGGPWTVPIDTVGVVLVALTAAAVYGARQLVIEPDLEHPG